MTEDQKPSQVAEEGNSAQAKLAAAVFGGYVLGRTKNGGAALSLASWLSGNQAGPRAMAMARKGLSQVAKSEQVAQIMQQIRGPMMRHGRSWSLRLICVRLPLSTGAVSGLWL